MDVLNHQPRRAGDGERRNGRSRRPASSVDGMASGSAAGERGVTRCQLPWRVGAAGCRQHWCHGLRRVNFWCSAGGRANDKSRPRLSHVRLTANPRRPLPAAYAPNIMAVQLTVQLAVQLAVQPVIHDASHARLSSIPPNARRLASPPLPAGRGSTRSAGSCSAPHRSLDVAETSSSRQSGRKALLPKLPARCALPVARVTFTLLPQARPRPAFANRLQPSQPDTQPSRPSASTTSTSRSR
jgi:hypothetical protein